MGPLLGQQAAWVLQLFCVLKNLTTDALPRIPPAQKSTSHAPQDVCHAAGWYFPGLVENISESQLGLSASSVTTLTIGIPHSFITSASRFLPLNTGKMTVYDHPFSTPLSWLNFTLSCQVVRNIF